MNRDDLIWLAGLCEGEATFDLQRSRYPRIRLAMTDRDTVGRAATLLGTSVRMTIRAYPFASMFHAELQGPRAAEIMFQLLPHMGARRSSKIGEILGTAPASSGGVQGAGPSLTRPPGITDPAVVA